MPAGNNGGAGRGGALNVPPFAGRGEGAVNIPPVNANAGGQGRGGHVNVPPR